MSPDFWGVNGRLRPAFRSYADRLTYGCKGVLRNEGCLSLRSAIYPVSEYRLVPDFFVGNLIYLF